MRAIYSYGIALVIVLVLAVWLASGMLVIGGKGPGNGETPVANLGNADQSMTDEQKQLAADAAAKSKAADDAKAQATAAEAAAAKAKAELVDATTADRKKELQHEVEEQNKLAEAAKAAADKASAESTAAADAAAKVKTELDAVRTIAERNDAQGSGAISTPRSVRVAVINSQPMSIDVTLRGRTKAKAAIAVVARTGGIIEEVNVAKGQSVKVGDALCTLDQGARKAAVDQAQAGLDQAQTAYDSNQALVKKGLAATNTALAAQSALEAAKSGLEQAQLDLARTVITSPVAGVVQDPLASVGTMLATGAPCATVVELNPMLFIASVPEAKIGYARLGLTATVTTVTDQKVEGKVTYIASRADDATRSFPIEIEIPNGNNAIRDGITAEATVIVGTAPAHLLPQSVLTLNDEGVLGIRTVEAGDKVAFHKIDIVKDTRDGVWVVGLPATINVITVGQEYVQPGQIVDARTAEGAKIS